MSLSVAVPTAVDRRQPWLGLSSYREADSALFFGRENEELELLRLVRREVLTVLFGPSGTGKTSLLNAGLFPRLRESAYLPIPIRLDHLSDRPDYVAQIRALIDEALHADATRPIEEESLAPQAAQDDQETLWEYLHRVVFWDWRNNPVTPVLVFDQFEEVFTLGRNHAATEEFLTALADLVENYIPAPVRSRTEANGGSIEFPHDQPKVKVILSLREDFVCRLDDLRKSMPSVMHNRLAVARMNGEQALRAVREPGQGIVEESVARQIVRFVAASNRSSAAADDEDVRLDNLEVDPALLSVVCRELNAHRIEREKVQITADLLEQTGTNILHDFYERGFNGLNPAIRIFVEDRLLTVSGFRSTVPLEEATHAGIADEDIRTLVDRRLIRVGGTPRHPSPGTDARPADQGRPEEPGRAAGAGAEGAGKKTTGDVGTRACAAGGRPANGVAARAALAGDRQRRGIDLPPAGGIGAFLVSKSQDRNREVRAGRVRRERGQEGRHGGEDGRGHRESDGLGG